MKTCPYCGKAIEENIQRCPNCFANVSTDTTIDVDEEAKKAKKKGEK